MKLRLTIKMILFFALVGAFFACDEPKKEKKKEVTAAVILGNPDYPAILHYAIRHGKFSPRCTTQNDVRILHALGYRLLRPQPAV